MIDPTGMAADTGKVAVVIPLVLPVLETAGIILQEVVIIATKVISTGASAAVSTVGAVLLPQNWQSEHNYWERPPMLPPPILFSNDKKSNVSNGDKNSPHANQKAKDAAEKRYKDAKDRYEKLKSKPNKTPDDKKQLEKLKKEVERERQKSEFKGENHSRNAKGN